MGLALESLGLVEREREFAALEASLTEAAAGRGGVALVYGEAGIGKTSLLRSFCDDSSLAGDVLWGACDTLFTPRPLGPVLDMARTARGELADVVAAGVIPHEVTAALKRSLTAHAPAIAVFEDMHLADEATLDVLRLLARGLEKMPVLVVVTYRDDELDRWHPLRHVLGEVASAAPVSRLPLSRLSPESVHRMAAGEGVGGEELYRKTLGNPFFVTEALASGGDEIPETVRDVVLGRAGRLSPSARRLLDAVAVARPHAEIWLLEALAADALGSLEEASASGMLIPVGAGVGFRHELARLAVEDAMPVDRKVALHRQALTSLAEPLDGATDPSRVAHHAEAVGDARLVLEYATRAAEQASLLGAHREAAAHYRRAMRFAGDAPLEVRADLSARCAQELFFIVEFSEAVDDQREALRCYQQLGDPHMQGAATSFLAHLLWESGSLREALETAERALELLEDIPGPAQVSSYCEMARLHLAAEDTATAAHWALRAQQAAEELDDPSARIMALQTVGWVDYFVGASGGAEKLLESLEMAERAGLDFMVSTAYVILVRTACRRREYAFADPYVRAGVDYCSVRDLDVWRYYLLSWESKTLLARGLWSAASDVAELCLTKGSPFARIHALQALGLVRARRGDPGAWEPLDEALELAKPREELQWIAPVAAARAEAAWLEGRNSDAVAETDVAWELAKGTWWAASLAYWRWRAGVDEPVPDLGEEQYILEMDGRWRDASESWRVGGCRYSAAFATLTGDDEEALRYALDEFRVLGAAPAAKRATARLRDIGAHGVPRGPHPSTRANPASLTHRELEVLDLLAEGLRNSEIAERLFITERTVDHHVSAILRKLGVTNRAQAATEAIRLGVAAER